MNDQIKELKGDVTQFTSLHGRLPILIHCCNNRKRIGAGVSGAIIRAFPGVKEKYLNGSFDLGSITTFTTNSGQIVCNIIGQDGYGKDGRCYVRYDALSRGMKELVQRFSGKAIEIHCPRLGCGLAGGDWNEIAALLEENFLAKGIPVTVYDLEQ